MKLRRAPAGADSLDQKEPLLVGVELSRNEDRATHRETELIDLPRGHSLQPWIAARIARPRVGVQFRILDVSHQIAVELLRSTLRHQADHARRGAAVFSRIVGSQHLDFRDRVQALRAIDNCSLTIAIHGGAVHRCQVLARPSAVDRVAAAETVAHIRAQRASDDSGFELHSQERIASADDQLRDLPLSNGSSQV